MAEAIRGSQEGQPNKKYCDKSLLRPDCHRNDIVSEGKGALNLKKTTLAFVLAYSRLFFFPSSSCFPFPIKNKVGNRMMIKSAADSAFVSWLSVIR